MYWIRTADGRGMANLAVASDVRVCLNNSDGGYAVKVFFPAGDDLDWSVVYAGTKEECQAVLARIASNVVAHTVTPPKEKP